MNKIPTLFVRDPEDRAHVLPVITEGCEWVLNGAGTATRKWDGTCVMLDDCHRWWARREVKPGKTPPPGYVPLSTDPVTGKTMGWGPIEQSAFAKFHAEALDFGSYGPGTYELVGPKINGNPEGFEVHMLLTHGWAPLSERRDLETAPRSYSGLREWLAERDIEGIVWHHPDGRMAKLKKRDFA